METERYLQEQGTRFVLNRKQLEKNIIYKNTFCFFAGLDGKPHNHESKIKPPLQPRPQWSRTGTTVDTAKAIRVHLDNSSSNINEVIKTVLNCLLFFYEKLLDPPNCIKKHQKTPKA